MNDASACPQCKFLGERCSPCSDVDDALLIAAAPDLLDALRDIASEIEAQVAGECLGDDWRATLPALIAKATAALRKAGV